MGRSGVDVCCVRTGEFVCYPQAEELQDGGGVDRRIWRGGWVHVPVRGGGEICEEGIDGIGGENI